MTTQFLINKSHPNSSPIRITLASSFFARFMGLMFKKALSVDSGILLMEKIDSKINTSIHMLFMNFDICVVWINSNFQVVDTRIAKKWRLAYFPRIAARYVLEIHPTRLIDFSIGDQLQFEHEK